MARLTDSIKEQADFTHSLTTTKRYIVGGLNLYTGSGKDLDLQAIVARAVDTLNAQPNLYDCVGGWNDSETGVYYVDANNSYDDLNMALIVGRNRGEIAIWDSIGFEEIRVAV